MSWNYRIVEKAGLFYVAEVHYGDNGIKGWSHVDGPDAYNVLTMSDDFDEFKGTAEKVLHAFHRPVLRWTNAGGKDQLIGVI